MAPVSAFESRPAVRAISLTSFHKRAHWSASGAIGNQPSKKRPVRSRLAGNDPPLQIGGRLDDMVSVQEYRARLSTGHPNRPVSLSTANGRAADLQASVRHVFRKIQPLQ